MFESWHNQQDDEETTTFWLQFQVMTDGFEETGPDSHHNDNINESNNENAFDGGITSNSLPPGSDKSANGILTQHPKEFHLFNQLPAELRLKIWSCLIRPRIVLAACLSSRPSTYKPLYHKISQRPKRPYIPVLLHICAESREFALQHYELTFSWKVPHRLRASSPSYSHPPHSQAPNIRSSSSSLPQPTSSNPPTHSPEVYFNYNLDTLFLLGELEPSDGHGFNAPMVYFLRREDTSRVKHVACAFEELHLGLYDTELVFGCLFHMVDRFPSARGVLPVDDATTNGQQQQQPTENSKSQKQETYPDGKKVKDKPNQPNQFLIITTTPNDASILPLNQLLSLPTTNNVIQKLWRAWAMGSGYWPGTGGGVEPSSSDLTTASSLVNTQMVMVPEEELARFVAQIQ